jgi:selenide,water dikinase
MTSVGVSAATDVTGFGLLGHLRTMARASGVSATVEAAAVPLLPGAEELANAGEVPGGTRSNERSLRTSVQWSDAVLPARRILLCDAQTSGGLLIAVPQSAQPRLEAELADRGVSAYRIGALAEGPAGTIVVQ